MKTSTPIPGAFVAPDGKALGIYQGARAGSAVAVDGAPVPTGHPAHVSFVRPDGERLMRLADDGNSAVHVCCAPGDLADLEPARVPDDLPHCPRNAHLFAAG